MYTTTMTWNLFLDDERNIDIFQDSDWEQHQWVVAKSTKEAIILIKNLGLPERIALDFHLQYGDTTIQFLKELRSHTSVMPMYRVHSSDFTAPKRIREFIQKTFDISLGHD